MGERCHQTKPGKKNHGQYFTPEIIAKSLVGWVIRKRSDRLLDPSCGDGRFLAQHHRSVGVERDQRACFEAQSRAPWSLIHEGDFFRWASETRERFECAAGNPPFIRYQKFSGVVRKRSLELCRALGANFSALTSSWAPFLVVTASLLKKGGADGLRRPGRGGTRPLFRASFNLSGGKFRRCSSHRRSEQIFSGSFRRCLASLRQRLPGQNRSFQSYAIGEV